MLGIRAHRGHENECQMVNNEAIWLFRICYRKIGGEKRDGSFDVILVIK